MDSPIPIKNIYYLLCYAWNRYEAGQAIDISDVKSPDVVDLLASILINGTNHILRRGLDKGYVSVAEDTSCLRGRISISETIKRRLSMQAKAHCNYDELTFDILHNQILRSTIHRLSAIDKLDKALKKKLRILDKKLEGITLIRITKQSFRQLQFHRNNAFYDLLMKVCELLHESLLPEQGKGSSRFLNFLEDEGKMNRIFEEFVRNFYRLEQKNYSVASEYIQWEAVPETEEAKNVLPSMLTDVLLRSKERTIILDTKYYKDPIKSRFGKKIQAGNLYQIFSYLKNFKEETKGEKETEGVLLYPTVSEDFDYRYDIQGHSVRVCTINLQQDWQGIHNDLLNLVE